jgi:16S rRNA processing protein RimM
LGAAHGVRGWLRVQSYTDPPQRLFEWPSWQLQSPGDAAGGVTREVKLLEARQQGNGWIVRLDGIEERNAASRLTGQMILVGKELLGPAREREHYRDDLLGFEAKNLDGVLLGVVDHFVDTPGNAVMVIKGVREHWVPVTSQHLRSIDKDARAVVVDWPEDF